MWFKIYKMRWLTFTYVHIEKLFYGSYYLASYTPGIANLENSEGGYFGFSAEGGYFWKIPHLKKAGKIGSSAFSVIKALIKLN